jgi:hypothetical protein
LGWQNVIDDALLSLPRCFDCFRLSGFRERIKKETAAFRPLLVVVMVEDCLEGASQKRRTSPGSSNNRLLGPVPASSLKGNLALALMKPTLFRRFDPHGGGGDDDDDHVEDASPSAAAGRKERTTPPIRAWVLLAMGLSVFVAYGLGRQLVCPCLQPTVKAREKKAKGGASSSSAPPPSVPWWQPVVQANRAKPEGLRVYESPIALAGVADQNDVRLEQLLKLLGANPSTNCTVIDIGLPMESITFATSGYLVQAFEARVRGYADVSEKLQALEASIRQRIQLHHTALSNFTGTTDLFDAEDSSSLIRGAVVNFGAEKVKFERTGQRVETVPVTTLDHHLRSLAASRDDDSAPALTASIVGIKIDTQGAEPEIFMGAESILSSPATRPRVIVMEYCARLRSYDELSVGVHLLHGLGYSCYYQQGFGIGASMVITAESGFCGDFYCTHQPLKAATAGSN